MKYKVLSTSPTFGYYADEPIKYLEEHGCEVKLVPQGKKLSEEELIELVKDVDAMVVGVEKITEKVINAASKMKMMTKHGAGYDNIDVSAATKKGIIVANAPGTNSDAVADLTIGLFLSLARRIPFADRAVKDGEWPRMVGYQLSGKVLGIIGLGQIGKRVAKRGTGFGMNILAYDIEKDETFARKWGVTYSSLDEVLAEADYISIHVPLTHLTKHMIGERELELMKNEAFLVNIARGNIVHEDALYSALKEKKIRAAALDVFSQEPPQVNDLLKLENLIVSPHMGAYTYEALRETGMICVRDIVDVLEGRTPKYAVNQVVTE